jgi:predicted  nucleic acid-binding Zn-ribbon protein
MREKVFSGGRDSEHLRKLSAENGEFKQQVATLQARVDTLASHRDRLERQLNETRADTQHFAGLEKEFGSIRAERDDLRKSTMAAHINVAKLKAQVNDLTSRDAGYLEHQLAIVTKERDSLEGQVKSLKTQLDETKKQVDVHVTRLRTMERNLIDARDDLERERKHAVDLLAVHNGSPTSDRTRRLNGEVRKLEDLLQQARLRQAELGRINATQLDEINTLNRRIEKLEGELEAIQTAHVQSAQNTLTGIGRDDKRLHKQLTLAKGQLADLKAKLNLQEREFELRLEEQLAEKEAKYSTLTEENHELKEEVDRLKKRQSEHVQTKVKLEEQIRSLQRQITRLESDIIHPTDNNNNNNHNHGVPSNSSVTEIQTRLNTVKKELDQVKQDATQKETKYSTQIRRLQNELDNLQTHSDALSRDLHLTKKESSATSALLRRQLAEARDTIKRGPSALTSQAERKHGAELRGLGKQIRYLKAKMFREETFKLDLQFAKKFFLMQIECYETLYGPRLVFEVLVGLG